MLTISYILWVLFTDHMYECATRHIMRFTGKAK